MREILTRPTYDGYNIKCGKCRCRFFAPFEDVNRTWSDELEYVNCPNCKNKIYYSLLWRKHKMTEDNDETLDR